MQLTRLDSAPFRQTDFLPVDLAVERRSDGSIVLRSRIPLREFEPCLPRVLATQAALLGNKPYLVQRQGPQRAWTPHSYADTKRDTDAIAQWLLDRGIARDRPILLLSGNSIAHALVKFGGMAVGVPPCPVSANRSEERRVGKSVDHGVMGDMQRGMRKSRNATSLNRQF